VAKRKRKERRQKQQAKAIQQGDLGALRAIVERNPEAGASALVTALQSAADPNESSFLQLAEQVIDSLRDKGRHDQVLRLVALFPSPSTPLRLARALSALAIGDDATASADASADARVHAFVAPLLAALHGTKIPRTPPKAPPSVRSILALSRAVAATTTGSSTPARTALRAVDAKWAPRLGKRELGLVLDLQAKRLPWYNVAPVVRTLLKSSLVRAHAPSRRAIAMELAPRFPELLLDMLLPELNLSPEDRAAVSLRASLADTALDSEQARVSRLIASAGAAAFPPEHRPVAHLFAGFATVRAEPKQAKACFDAAIAAGADLGEALRGRVLADTVLQNDREAAKTCLRLAKLLEREPDGAPLALLAAKTAATAAAFAQDLHAAREALTLARAIGERTGLLDAKRQAEFLIIESKGSHINKAGAFLEQAMALDPRNVEVWQARVDLARARGRAKEAEDLILQAGELQIDEGFVALARQVRAKRGERWEPEPGKATAGELAAELYHRIENNPDLDPNDDLLRCRAELSPTARVAFDMAYWATLSSFDHDDAAEGLLRAAWADPDLDDHARNAWVLLAADYGAPESVIPLLVERATKDPNDRILLLACGLMGIQDKSQVNHLIAQLAPFLSRSRLNEIRGAVYRSLHDRSAEDTLLQLLKPFFSVLQPHYSLKAVLDGEVPVPRVYGDEDEDEDSLLRDVLGTLGAPSDLLENASLEQLVEARKIVEAIATAQSKNKVGRLVERLRDVLEDPTNHRGSIPF